MPRRNDNPAIAAFGLALMLAACGDATPSPVDSAVPGRRDAVADGRARHD